jgi:uncharacterized protein
MPEWLLVSVVALAIFVGIIGTIVPVIPGLLLSWGAVIVYGLVRGFGVIGWLATIVATVLMVVGHYIGFRIPQRDAAALGITKLEQLFSLALGVVGFFVIPVVGLPVGFVLGVFLARMRATGGDTADAWASTVVVLRSQLKAAGWQALCGVGIAVVWILWVTVR